METSTSIDPPSYYHEAIIDADDVMQPMILILEGQSIYAESDPNVHLYRLNRGVANLGPATSMVEFERLESNHPGTGTKPPRYRHVYNLHHAPTSLKRPSAQYAEYFIQAVAAPTRHLGHLGLKRASGSLTKTLTKQWTVLQVDMKGWAKQSDGILPGPPYKGDTTPLFVAHREQGVCKWVDGDSNDLAAEYDAEQEHHRLLITASIRRETLDALVALWCCRLWQLSVNEQRSHAVPETHFHSKLDVGWNKFR